MTKTVQRASRIVLRSEDSLIFDPRSFTVHKLSETALELMELFEKVPKDIETVITQAATLKFDPDHIREFIDLGTQAGFLETN